jgi:hypothetical protein
MKMTVLLAMALAIAVVAPVISQFNPITGLPPPPMAAKINVTGKCSLYNVLRVVSDSHYEPDSLSDLS